MSSSVPQGQDALSRVEVARRALAEAEARHAIGSTGSTPGADRPGGVKRSSSTEKEQQGSSAPAADPYETARHYVLRLLTAAPRSRADLAEKLRRRGIPLEVASSVLDRMEEVGLVDDREYAGMLVRSVQSGRGLARRGLRVELRRHGIDPELAEEALAQVDEVTERDEARRVVDKRLRTMHGLPRPTQIRRLAGTLARKGYSADVSAAVIREALQDSPEHQRD
ncbi:Regulatory protein RecX [Austwickia sp. TVS 96-490-7B]|uniref:regulatory protein RecX n=1 Tax=Austwickia sp. TVS 96-490-7B TaxID=2830843 RepID=UPI001D3D3142|nr:regulatory protein RecX [Austwickia sp. TVS 96-490-7B]MBW3086478.1 Regulatory protein RecX [Austwickia sp. TVS 96-490-7B]